MAAVGHLPETTSLQPNHAIPSPTIQFAAIDERRHNPEFLEMAISEDWPSNKQRKHQPPPAGQLSRHKAGFFQSLSLRHRWIDSGGGNGFGLNHTQAALSVAVPLPNPDWPLLITPAFNSYGFEGPQQVFVPGQVYDASLSLIWVPKVSDRWQAIIAVVPGVYSDFEESSADSLRIKGAGVLRYAWSANLELQAGVAYLDRPDVGILPAAGLIWRPNDQYLLELTLPRPKLAKRIWGTRERESWLYLAGELGGESWIIHPQAGQSRRMTLREYRLMLGLERIRDGGAGWVLEAGLAFDRRLRFDAPDLTIRGHRPSSCKPASPGEMIAAAPPGCTPYGPMLRGHLLGDNRRQTNYNTRRLSLFADEPGG